MKKIFFLFLIVNFLFPTNIFASNWELKVHQPTVNTKNVNGFDKLKVHDLFSWAGVYSLPMNFPKGPKWIQVGLNLNYNSYSTDSFSPYGYAWWLQGISQINRATKKGTTEVYNRNDFIVDGQELILTDATKNLYESKLSNNLNKYYFKNNSWKVLDTKWNIYTYWKSFNSKLFDPTNQEKTFSWYLEKFEDNRNNIVDYHYFKDSNQVYIDYIEYAGGLYKIDFNYYNKANSLSNYRTHFEVKTSKLVDEIKFYTDRILIKQYKLEYDNKDAVFSHLINFSEQIINNSKTLIKVSDYSFGYGKAADLHRLKKISTNTGLQVQFEYKPSVFYKDDSGKNLNPRLPFNMRTLHKINYEDVSTWLKRQEIYTYADGAFYFDKSDLYGREYAGFWKVTRKLSTWNRDIYYFHQGKNSVDKPELWEFDDHISKKWKTFRTEKFNSSWSLINSEITKWITKFESNNKWKVLLKQSVKNLINNENITSSATSYKYDAYWNVIETINYWEVSLLSQDGKFSDIWNDKTVSKLSYKHNADKNLYAYVTSQELYDYKNDLANKKQIIYDNSATWSLVYGDVTNVKTFESENKFSEEKNYYNSKWLLEKSTNSRGYSNSYVYDNYRIYPVSVKNAKNFLELIEYNYWVWKPKKSISVNGLITLIDYDNAGRILSENFSSDKIYRLKTISYDTTSTPNSVTQTQYFEKNTNENQKSFTYLNGFWETVQTKVSHENQFVTNKINYDERGNKTFVSYPTFEIDSNYTLLDESTELWVKYCYDSSNRIKKISDKSWDSIYDYNNLDFSITNQKGIVTKYEYDIFWNLVKVIENFDETNPTLLNSSYNDKNLITKYEYSVLNQLTKITDAKWNIRNISYDISWKRKSIEDLHHPSDTDFWTRKYKYDENGNISEFTTLAWEKILYKYDELDRLKQEKTSTEITNYTYDLGAFGKGQLSSYTKWNYTESYTYNIYWNLVSETKNFNWEKFTNSYDYNLAWQLISQTYPDDKTTFYDFNNWIAKSVIYEGKKLLNWVSYNPAGKNTELIYWNNSKINNIFEYDFGYRLKSKSLKIWENTVGNTNYIFDSVWNIKNLTESWTIPWFQKNISYTYDNLNRLLSTKYSESEIYSNTYDELWNILTSSKYWNYTYADLWTNNPHAVTSINKSIGSVHVEKQFLYNNNWNVVFDNEGTYSYNAKDELVQFKNASWAIVNYTYNNSWIRIQKSWSWFINKYINKDYEVIQRGSGTGVTIQVKKYIFFNGSKLASINQDETITYHHQDHLDWANIDFSQNWTILQVVDYLPFGEIRKQENSGEYENKHKFTGKERDVESGLDYFEARYYDSVSWRFRSIDRVFWEVWATQRWLLFLADPQQLNAYHYARNNPIIYNDPNGENPVLRWALSWVGNGVKFVFKKAVKQVVKETAKQVWKIIIKTAKDSTSRAISKTIQKTNSIKVPNKVINVLKKIEARWWKAPNWYVWGRVFHNKAWNLPKNTRYKEYDINPYRRWQNRWAERLVIDNKWNSYYTLDHYKSFIKIIIKWKWKK